MAIEVQSADHAGYGTASDTYAGPVPGTINEGDLIDATIVANTTSNDSLTPPSGWTTLVDDGSGNLAVTYGNGYWWGWHEVTAAEAASPPASWDFVLGTARTGNVIIRRITGHLVGDPFNTSVSQDSGQFSDSVPLTCAALTTDVDDCMLIGGCNVQSATARTITEPTVPGAWTEDDSTCTLTLGRGQDVAHYAMGSAGSTGDVEWYQSGADLAGAAFMIAVQPAIGGLVLDYTPTGGVLTGGGAPADVITAVPVAGGLLVGGAASVDSNPKASVVGDGGVRLGGAAPAVALAVVPASGGVLAAGTAPIEVLSAPAADGGLLVGGTAPVTIVATVPATGGLLVGGTAPVAVAPSVTGGVDVGGSATVAAVITVTVSGGIVVGGQADYSQPEELIDHTASGGILTSGAGLSATSSPRTAYAVGHRFFTFRYELYDMEGAFVADLDNVLSARVSMSWLAPIKRKAEFVLLETDTDIDWLTDRIKPWVRLHLPPYGDNDWVEWPMGVFLLSSPTRTINDSGAIIRSVTGYDLLQVLSDDLMDDRYTIPADTTHTDEVVTLLGDLPYKLTAHASTTRVAREYDPGTSKLAIINDLLSSINYKSLAFDEDGVALIEPYVSPADRTEEWTYADDETSLITPDVEQELDLFSVANRWVLVVSNPDAPALVSSYTNDNPASPTSTVRRGRTIVDFRTEEEADSQADLDAKVAQLAFNASQVYEHIRFTTGLNPLHSCNDVFRITFSGLAVNSAFVETKWEMELRAGAAMTHEARRVVAV